MAKRKDYLQDLRRRLNRALNDLAKTEIQLIEKEIADKKYGRERADLERLIAELNKSIEELPEGSLRAVSTERRDELELRLKNLTIRYPKGSDKPQSYYDITIPHHKKQIAILEESIEKITAERAALQNKTTHTPTLIVVSKQETETKSDAEPEAGKEDEPKEDGDMK